MSLKDRMKQDEKDPQKKSSGDFFKFVEGDNKIRVLAEPLVIFKDFNLGICYTECGFQGSMKYATWIAVYDDDGSSALKWFEMPKAIMDALAAFELNEDYRFEGFPMPYDIVINAKEAGTTDVKYTVTPRRQNTPVPEKITAELAKQKSVADRIEQMKANNRKRHMEDGTWDRLHDDEGGGVRQPSAAAQRGSRGTGERAHKPIAYPETEIDVNDIPF